MSSLDKAYLDKDGLLYYHQKVKTLIGTMIADAIEDNFIELTQAEYDALPETKYSDNVNYFIIDAGNVDEIRNSTDITFNPGASGISATNVQTALDYALLKLKDIEDRAVFHTTG